MNKMEELLNVSKLSDLLHRKEKELCEEKSKNKALIVLAVVGAVAAIGAIAYGVYRFFTPDYLDDFEDDLDDDFFDEAETKEASEQE